MARFLGIIFAVLSISYFADAKIEGFTPGYSSEEVLDTECEGPVKQGPSFAEIVAYDESLRKQAKKLDELYIAVNNTICDCESKSAFYVLAGGIEIYQDKLYEIFAQARVGQVDTKLFPLQEAKDLEAEFSTVEALLTQCQARAKEHVIEKSAADEEKERQEVENDVDTDKNLGPLSDLVNRPARKAFVRFSKDLVSTVKDIDSVIIYRDLFKRKKKELEDLMLEWRDSSLKGLPESTEADLLTKLSSALLKDIYSGVRFGTIIRMIEKARTAIILCANANYGYYKAFGSHTPERELACGRLFANKLEKASTDLRKGAAEYFISVLEQLQNGSELLTHASAVVPEGVKDDAEYSTRLTSLTSGYTPLIDVY